MGLRPPIAVLQPSRKSHQFLARGGGGDSVARWSDVEAISLRSSLTFSGLTLQFGGGPDVVFVSRVAALMNPQRHRAQMAVAGK